MSTPSTGSLGDGPEQPLDRAVIGNQAALDRQLGTPLVQWPVLVGLVLAATLLNAWKPVHIDDAAYLTYARHIVDDPGHPYAFEMFWYDVPQPAIEVLAPPVYLYWLALGVFIAPDNPVVWHAMVFPWLLLLAVSLKWLARRLCGTDSNWMIAAFLFSPVVLPGINLMLDLPALALTTAALALFLRALDRNAVGQAALAGLVLAAAFETKYTAATMFAVWMGAAWFSPRQSRWSCLAAAMLAAIGGIAGVESWIAWGHGQSHLLVQLFRKEDRFPMLLEVYLCQAAIAVPAATLLAVVAFWRRLRGRRQRIITVVLTAGAACVLLLLSGRMLPVLRAQFLGASAVLLVGLWGVRGAGDRAGRGVLWWYFICELGYAVLISPFPAMRRVLGPAVPLTLLAVGGSALNRDRLARLIIGISIVSGVVFWHLDFSEARLQQQAPRQIVDEYAQPGQSIWFTGHWGWEYYARQAGMRPVVPGRSRIEPGDVVVIPREIAGQKFVMTPVLRHESVFVLPPSPPVPVTMLHYYSGVLRVLPEPHPGFMADVYRARAPMYPQRQLIDGNTAR